LVGGEKVMRQLLPLAGKEGGSGFEVGRDSWGMFDEAVGVRGRRLGGTGRVASMEGVRVDILGRRDERRGRGKAARPW
jgi:hypothetical protein